MNFDLTWNATAFDQMALIVRNHPEHKTLLADSLRELTAALRAAPAETGESREGYDRIGFFGPLVVTFRVFSADRRVLVSDVHLGSLLL